MRKVTLTRRASGPDGTPGEWLSDSGLRLATIERQWLNNAHDVSCIMPPPGEMRKYICHWGFSPKHGWCFYVMNVVGRGDIEIHSANLWDQLLGCVALGMATGKFLAGTMMHIEGPGGLEVVPLPRDMMGIVDSKTAILKMQMDMGTEDFELTIQWGEN